VTTDDIDGIIGRQLLSEPDEDGAVLVADPTPRMRLLLAIAAECGALDRRGRRVTVNHDWETEDVVVRADIALNALLDLGPMRTSWDVDHPVLSMRDAVLDANCVSFLATILRDGSERSVEHVANTAIDMCREHGAGDPLVTTQTNAAYVRIGTAYLVETLAWGGAVEWTGADVCRSDLMPDWPWLGGGTIRLTALGRHVVPDRLAESGLCLREPAPPGTQRASSLLGDLYTAECDLRPDLVRGWRSDLSAAERARDICRALIEPQRVVPEVLAGFDALAIIGADTAEPYVRQLLDSPVAEHAASFLVDHGLADPDALAPFIGYNPLIDHLATLVSRPDELRRWLVYLLENSESPELMLEVIALHRTESATALLTAAARHVTDPRFADLVRAAEVYHTCVLNDVDPDAYASEMLATPELN
jgi:hypothetical protein